MKLNKLIYGVLTIFAFSSCADQMLSLIHI